MVKAARVVLDTNILVSAMLSRRGASFRVIDEIGRGPFEVVVSVPLVVEYEVALLEHRPANVSPRDVAVVLDFVCAEAHEQEIYYLWQDSYVSQEVERPDDSNSKLLRATKIADVVRHNRVAPAGNGNFQHHVILRVAEQCKELGIRRLSVLMAGFLSLARSRKA